MFCAHIWNRYMCTYVILYIHAGQRFQLRSIYIGISIATWMCRLQQVQAQSAASSSGGYTPRSEASTSVAGTPNTPWQEEAALQVCIPDFRGDCIVVLVCGNTNAASLSPMRAGTIHWSCVLCVYQSRHKSDTQSDQQMGTCS